jgi:aminomethyltransferase
MTLRQTAFKSRIASMGATFDEYAGYEFAYRYGDDILAEYWACRRRAAVIDLTPLRKVEVSGRGAEALLQAVVTRDLSRLSDGHIVYTALCDDEGNVIDDGTVFRFEPDRFRWVGYTDEDEAWFRTHADRLGLEVSLENSTDRIHNIAVQGPRSRDLVTGLIEPAPGRPQITDLTWFRFTEGNLGGADGPAVLLSRTGYSGELGYELWCHPDDGPTVWDAVFEAGEPLGVGPLGLDALDPLRVEAGLIFKGYEYEGEEDPFEAGIGFVVSNTKSDDFVGKAALARRRKDPSQVFVGLEVDDADPLVHGDHVVTGDRVVGVVTSGALSPVLERNLAFARVGVTHGGLGARLEVERADAGPGRVPATVVRVPFYDPDKTRPRS